MAAGLNAREPLYTRDILRLAASLAARSALARVDGRAEVRSPTCGSRIATEVTVNDGRVTALRQSVEACAFGQASAALVEAGAPGLSHDEIAAALHRVEAWLAGTGKAEPWPGFATLDPARSRSGRHGAMLLPFRALLAAIEDAA